MKKFIRSTLLCFLVFLSTTTISYGSSFSEEESELLISSNPGNHLSDSGTHFIEVEEVHNLRSILRVYDMEYLEVLNKLSRGAIAVTASSLLVLGIPLVLNLCCKDAVRLTGVNIFTATSVFCLSFIVACISLYTYCKMPTGSALYRDQEIV